MKIDRRGFLAGLLAGAGAAAAGELIVPSRSIFLPPRGGWLGRSIRGGVVPHLDTRVLVLLDLQVDDRVAMTYDGAATNAYVNGHWLDVSGEQFSGIYLGGSVPDSDRELYQELARV